MTNAQQLQQQAREFIEALNKALPDTIEAQIEQLDIPGDALHLAVKMYYGGTVRAMIALSAIPHDEMTVWAIASQATRRLLTKSSSVIE